MFEFIRDIKNRDFMRLWCAQLISQFGDRLHQMALIGFVAERFAHQSGKADAAASALGLAKLLSFTIIPVFIVGPIAGVLVDRWDRRKTLFVCDILRGLLVLLIPFVFMDWDSLVPLYIVVFLAFCCSRFYVPAKMSIIPDLVEEKNLLVANSLMTTTGMIAFVMGASLGGFVVENIGARAGFIGDAVTFYVSSALIISISKNFHLKLGKKELLKTGKELLTIEKSILAEVKEGVLYLINHKEIRFVISMLFTLLTAAGAVYVVIIVFIQQAFHSVTKDLGVLAVFLGAGLFIGVVLYGRWGKRIVWYKTIFSCLVAGGVMMIVFASAMHSYPNIFLGMGLTLLLGVVIGPIFVASNTVVHFVADENMRGKVFTALEIVIHFAFLVSMLVSSFLARYVEPVWILVGVGILFTLIGLAGFIRYRKDGELAKVGQKMA